MVHYISNQILLLEDVQALLANDIKLKLSEEAKLNIQKCGSVLTENQLYTQHKAYDLLTSYACGIGEPVPDNIVKLMIFLKIQSLCYGFSGVRIEVIERFLNFYNNGVLPVVYSQDTPDDRISLAHLSLPLIGKGEVRIGGKIFSACELTSKFGWQPLQLHSNEIDALLGGTQLTTAYGANNLINSLKISVLSDFVASMSAQLFGINPLLFSEQVQVVRPHKGQIQTAENLRNILKNNVLPEKNTFLKSAPEAFCAIPQVHGAVKDAIWYVRRIIKTEINSSTDNLLIFPENQYFIYGGNSHTLPLSIGLDFLAIALTSLGNISERRIFHLISTLKTNDEDKNYKIFLDLSVFQRITEGILAENKRLSMPISVESPIFTEKTADIKGMGASSAIKSFQIIKNMEKILAIELLTIYLITSMKNIRFHSQIFNEYISFLGTNNQEFYVKKHIERTIEFFNENESLSELLKNNNILKK